MKRAVFICAAAAFITTWAPQALAQRAVLEPALRDPFALPAPVIVAPAPPAAKPVPPVPPIVAPSPPSAPPPPELQLAGRFEAPDGTRHLWVRVAGQLMRVTSGMALPQGWQVQAVTASALELVHPQLEQPQRVPLPAAPAFERR